MCFKRAGGYGWLEMSPCVLVALDVFAWILPSFLPFFWVSVCVSSFVDSRVEGCGLWAAVSSSQGDANIALGYRNG